MLEGRSPVIQEMKTREKSKKIRRAFDILHYISTFRGKSGAVINFLFSLLNAMLMRAQDIYRALSFGLGTETNEGPG